MTPSTFARSVTALLLRSPLSGLLDRAVLLLSVPGRHTGRVYTLPVQYAVADGVVWVLPGHHERKTWWRNLETPAAVELTVRRRTVRGKGEAFLGWAEPDVVAQGLRVYLQRFPALAKRWGVGPDGPDHEVVSATVMVRVVLDDPAALG